MNSNPKIDGHEVRVPKNGTAKQGHKLHLPTPTSGYDLQRAVLPDIRWAVPGIIPEGGMIVAGRPKLGKTTWALNLACAIGHGGKAWSAVDVEPGFVLFLSLETGRRSLQRALKAMNPDRTAPTSLQLVFGDEWPYTGREAADALRAMMKVHDYRLVVVDTFKAFSGASRSGGTQYDIDYEAIKPLNDVAQDTGTAMIYLHHPNKAEWADPFDAISGSRGIRGAVDSEAVLIDDPHAGAGRGIIFKARGRDLEDVEQAFTFDPSLRQWNLRGDAKDAHRSDTRALIVKILRASGRPWSPSDLHAEMTERGYGGAQSTVRTMLRKMSEQLREPVAADKGGKYIYHDAQLAFETAAAEPSQIGTPQGDV